MSKSRVIRENPVDGKLIYAVPGTATYRKGNVTLSKPLEPSDVRGKGNRAYGERISVEHGYAVYRTSYGALVEPLEPGQFPKVQTDLGKDMQKCREADEARRARRKGGCGVNPGMGEKELKVRLESVSNEGIRLELTNLWEHGDPGRVQIRIPEKCGACGGCGRAELEMDRQKIVIQALSMSQAQDAKIVKIAMPIQ